VLKVIARVAPTGATVLLEGESGTGKNASRGCSTSTARTPAGRSSR
jgi:DNA-binding NtrC family response regulator